MKSTTQFPHFDAASAKLSSLIIIPLCNNRSRTLTTTLATMLSAAALTACGGGGASATDTTQTLAAVKTATPANSGVFTPATPAAPVAPVAPTVSPIVAGTVLTDIRIQNTGAAQTNVPFTFGQVFAVGALKPTDGLAAKLADGTLVRLQMDTKATHADGSVRHAIVSGILPALAADQTQKLDLAKSTASETSVLTPQNLATAGLTSTITVTIAGVAYTATLADAIAGASAVKWLSGSVANEWIGEVPLKSTAGAVHPLLTARFGVRWYSGLSKQARVEVGIENDKTFAAPANRFTYDVKIDVAGRTTYSKTALTQFHHSRWHQVAWWDATRQPDINLQHNSAYLIASKAVSNYNQSLVIPEDALNTLGNSISADNTGPMTIGPVVPYMGTTGGRGDIGPLPAWSVTYLLSMDKRAYKAMMAAADGSGTWSIHYRDEKTGAPLRLDNDVNKNITTHWNAVNSAPLPSPWFATDGSVTPYTADVAHQPSLVYLPYLVTGDHYYLEELQFWATKNPLETSPTYRDFDKGLMRWEQVRGQAWALRTLGHAAYITPDASPMKAYFTKQLDANLDFYNATYVVGNPNKLGLYDGSGAYSVAAPTTAPWQDDFFTWSFSYLAELGFAKADPILKWKAKYVVGRMSDPGYCWVMGATYVLGYRESDGKVMDSFSRLYTANFADNAGFYGENGNYFDNPLMGRFVDQPCGSAAQATYLGLANGFTWNLGRMVGTADSPQGQTSIMQPALAAAVTAGLPNAQKAWTTFGNRSTKPDFRYNPQFDILPR